MKTGIRPVGHVHPLFGRQYFCHDCFRHDNPDPWTYFPKIHRWLNHHGPRFEAGESE